MIEVFKTNVSGFSDADRIVKALHGHFPVYRINFDLHDCDKILRVETHGPIIDIPSFLAIARQYKFEISLLEE